MFTIHVQKIEDETKKTSVEEYSFGTDIPVGIYEGFNIKVE